MFMCKLFKKKDFYVENKIAISISFWRKSFLIEVREKHSKFLYFLLAALMLLLKHCNLHGSVYLLFYGVYNLL
jgi:hypothetical protein